MFFNKQTIKKEKKSGKSAIYQIGNQKGIGLVEVIAALGISVIVITALVSLSLYTLRSSLQSKLQLEATKLANRELEMLRAFRDQNTWADFRSDLLTYTCETNACHVENTAGVFSVSSGSADEIIDNQTITRSFMYTPDSEDPNDIVEITVTVTWVVGADTKETNLYTHLTNWQNN